MGAKLKEKDASPSELRINFALQKLRSLQGAAIISLVKAKWRHRVRLMPSFAIGLGFGDKWSRRRSANTGRGSHYRSQKRYRGINMFAF